MIKYQIFCPHVLIPICKRTGNSFAEISLHVLMNAAVVMEPLLLSLILSMESRMV